MYVTNEPKKVKIGFNRTEGEGGCGCNFRYHDLKIWIELVQCYCNISERYLLGFLRNEDKDCKESLKEKSTKQQSVGLE